MTTVISLEDVGKQYRLGVIGHGTLRHDLESWWARIRGREDPNAPIQDSVNDKQFSKDTMWALRNISLELKQGEVLGIIGRNGAGKTTLLKIVSRLTAPTTGRVKIRGRLACLLEVGTGFHPDLTGRENVFVNGTIMGMTIGEIRSKFDEIVAFSGLERFIDTPVKRYSSGMYVRLGFAVAVHLDPEILVVDEVLAVGDSDFQKKCMSKIERASGEGRTILFVSHNMNMVNRLCTHAILLEEGRMIARGTSGDVVNTYLSCDTTPLPSREWSEDQRAMGSEVARLLAARVRNASGLITDTMDVREPIAIEMEFEVLKAGHVLTPNYHVVNDKGTCVFVVRDIDPKWLRKPRPSGRFVTTAWVPGNLMAEGRFSISFALTTFRPFYNHFYAADAVSFQVVDPGGDGTARGDSDQVAIPGAISPLLKWHNEYRPDT
jgi:lipopolysaccharide transport system ATP-binding protein